MQLIYHSFTGMSTITTGIQKYIEIFFCLCDNNTNVPFGGRRMDKNLLDVLFDDNDIGSLTLQNEDGEKVEFRRMAIIPYKDIVYAILKPISGLPEEAMQQGIAMRVEMEFGEPYLSIEDDEEVLKYLMNEYNRLLKEDEET